MAQREGNLQAPTRHPLDWQSDDFYNEDSLNKELERVFDICHGCRRCVSLCDAFPTLFDLVDESDTFEVDGVDKADYAKVSDQCYMCDMCYMAKCPYTPPHEWNVDFPHLMLRAKAVKFTKSGASLRDRILTSTDTVGKLATIPLVDITVNALNKNNTFRKALDSGFGVHHQAPVPEYHSKTMHKRVAPLAAATAPIEPVTAGNTKGKVALYVTCYGNYNSPHLGEDFHSVFTHNGIQIDLVPKEQCCGMPKLELGDLQAVAKLKEANIPVLAKLVDEGYDLIAPIPSCVLMYKQELPLMFPDDADTRLVKEAMFDIANEPWLFLLVFPSVAIGAPLAEEVIFRGQLFSALSSSRIGPFGATLLTSLIWSVLHVTEPWLSIGLIFVMGLIFGWLMVRFGSLWLTIACHGLWNGFYSLLIFFNLGGGP